MMTKADYTERKARVDAGTGSDEDRRLVKLYEQTPVAPDTDEPEPQPDLESGGASSAGSSTRPSADRPQRNEPSSGGSRRSGARSAEKPSK
jgi:hypothetical protein